jgi:hypothetical protein
MNSTVLNYPETVPVSAPGRGERTKGGEKTKSEWEELEKLTKDELIIELVHWKNMYGIIRVEQDDDCPWPYMEPKSRDVDGWVCAGEPTTHKWAEAVAIYAANHTIKEEFHPIDLMDYGLDEDQSYEVCRELRRKGELKLPDGVRYGGDGE